MKKADIILAVGLFIIGILVGKYINWPYFHISKEIDFAEVLSAGSSFILAYLVVKILEKGKEERRIEKDYLISKIEEVNNECNQLISTIRTGQIDYTKAVSSFKVYNIKIKKILKIANKIKIDITEQEKQKILKSLKIFKDLTTFTPRTLPANSPIQIINNIVFFSNQRISEIETQWDRLEDYMFDLHIKVNKG